MAANGLGWKLGQLKDGLAKRKELEGARRENNGQNGRPKAARTREPEWRQPVTHTNPLPAQPKMIPGSSFDVLSTCEAVAKRITCQ